MTKSALLVKLYALSRDQRFDESMKAAQEMDGRTSCEMLRGADEIAAGVINCAPVFVIGRVKCYSRHHGHWL